MREMVKITKKYKNNQLTYIKDIIDHFSQIGLSKASPPPSPLNNVVYFE